MPFGQFRTGFPLVSSVPCRGDSERKDGGNGMRKYFSCLPAFSLAKEPSGVALSELSPALDKYDGFVGILFC